MIQKRLKQMLCSLRKEWLLILMLIFILGLVFLPREKIFTIDVSTEIVSFRISDPQYSEWNIGSASIQIDFFDESGEATLLPPFARLEPAMGVDVELQRHGIGPIYLKLTCNEGSVGRIDTGDGEYIELGEWLLISVDAKEKPRIFPFRGTLDIGDDVTVDVESILLNGMVSIVEEKLFTNGHYTAGQEVLIPGDRVQLWKSNRVANKQKKTSLCVNPEVFNVREKSELDGFVRAEPVNNYTEPVNALNLVAHGKADYAEVNRFGSAGYEIKVQPLTRFINDPILLMLIGALTAFALLFELVSKVRTFNNSKEKDVDIDD